MLKIILEAIEDCLRRNKTEINEPNFVKLAIAIKSTKEFILLRTVYSPTNADLFVNTFLKYCWSDEIAANLIVELFQTMMQRVHETAKFLREPRFEFLITQTNNNFKEGFLF